MKFFIFTSSSFKGNKEFVVFLFRVSFKVMITKGQGGTLGRGTEMTNGRDFNGPERERRAFSCRCGFIVKKELEYMVLCWPK